MRLFFLIQVLITCFVFIISNKLDFSGTYFSYNNSIYILTNIIWNLQILISIIYTSKKIKNNDTIHKTLIGVLSSIYLLSTIDLVWVLGYMRMRQTIPIYVNSLLIILFFLTTFYYLAKLIKYISRYKIFYIVFRDSLIAFIPIAILFFDSLDNIFLITFLKSLFLQFENVKFTFSVLEKISMIFYGFFVMLLFMFSIYKKKFRKASTFLLASFFVSNFIYYSSYVLNILDDNVAYALHISLNNFLHIILHLMFLYYLIKDQYVNEELINNEHNQINNKITNIFLGIIPLLFLLLYIYVSKFIDSSISPYKYIKVTIISITLLIFRDALVLDENIKLLKNIKKQSKLDYLCEIYNRIGFNSASRSFKNNYTLFFFDIKKFKDINDIYGHESGDNALVFVANLLRSISEDIDKETLFCRYGGDEFIFAIKSVDKNYIDNLSSHFSKKRYINALNNDYKICIKLDVGYSVNTESKHISRVVQEADYAMYVSKRNVSGAVVEFDSKLKDEFDRVNLLKKEFKNDLSNKKIYAVYQPKVSIDSNKVLGYETLCRWNNDVLGELSPNDFLPVIENMGNMNVLDVYIFEEACKFQNLLSCEGIYQQCSVNISLKTLQNPSTCEKIIKITQNYNINPKNITLEILESITSKNNLYILERIKTLSDFGFLISIDDFGTEYSSLSKLFTIKFDEIKIPIDFVKEIDNMVQFNVVKYISNLANELNIKTVVEGIENETQLKVFQLLNFNSAQGFYFSRPLKAEDYITFYKENIKKYWK
ncbi:Phytochrome-like protein cph2 [Romboutsia lituseburensis]|uniref:Diguanylate cyclase (GGDEF) domain-containing protein n=1 Tax=Romboutsia lituseburensis DSM 797 TaxID=1121325 RepID=A0A1G9PF78_9FIRM|nr:bifunctional diguanylate cyclase/phosphodiesterase [Romboutsia lituseburensis]CEH33363.1 Phytochrome-like protein cph2 [Romboutsia lituseburensis]SDL97476.1 diguanylate cyclase (GGDEF) domain-containing protein [Romboutsia lituseburensis DSM 797]